MPLEAGNSAPPLATPFPDQNGEEHTIATHLQNGPVLLAVYKSSCLACKTMMPILNRVNDRYGSQGLSIFGIAQDSANVTRSFIRRTGLNYPVLIEGEDYPLSHAFEIFATPAIYVIDKDGNITYTTMGFMRDQVNDIGAAAAAAVGATAEPIITEADEEEIPRFVPGCPGKHLD